METNELNLELKIEGMRCEGCVKSVTRVLSALPGVKSVEVSLEAKRASVRYDPSRAGADAMRRAVEGAGFKAA
jgi:copper chaperone